MRHKLRRNQRSPHQIRRRIALQRRGITSRRRSLHTRGHRTRSRQTHILIRMRHTTGKNPIRRRRTRSVCHNLRLIAPVTPHTTSPTRTHPMQLRWMPRRTSRRDRTHAPRALCRNPEGSLSPRNPARAPTSNTRAHTMTLRSPSMSHRRRMACAHRTRLRPRQTTGTKHRNQSHPQRNRTSTRKRISSRAHAVLPLGEPPLRHHHHKF